LFQQVNSVLRATDVSGATVIAIYLFLVDNLNWIYNETICIYYGNFKQLTYYNPFLIQFTIAGTEPANPDSLMECTKESTITGTLFSVPAGNLAYTYYATNIDQLGMDMGWSTAEGKHTIFSCAQEAAKDSSDSKLLQLYQVL